MHLARETARRSTQFYPDTDNIMRPENPTLWSACIRFVDPSLQVRAWETDLACTTGRTFNPGVDITCCNHNYVEYNAWRARITQTMKRVFEQRRTYSQQHECRSRDKGWCFHDSFRANKVKWQRNERKSPEGLRRCVWIISRFLRLPGTAYSSAWWSKHKCLK